jgi:hypothetical protein|tara:strand:+ start:1909 stop:3060 length:1152 start_codon:yes stop_codon:yes gene_type:complete
MKYLIKFFTLLLFIIFFASNASANNKIKIGLVVPLSGENKDIGESILKSVRLAVNDIDDNKILIVPKDNQSNPNQTLKVSKELYDEGIKIIIGPIFKKNTLKLDKLNKDLIFLSFTNKIGNTKKNIISAGVNSVSQFNAIKKFQSLNKIERSYLFAPNNNILEEIKIGVKKSKIKLKDKFFYDQNPTKITKQIEDETRYRIRKQNLLNEIKRVKNSDEINKEKKIAHLETLDTMGGINFDSIIIADFEETLKSVATSLIYTDIPPTRVTYITLNQWFDKSLLNESMIQPIFFPSVNYKNYMNYLNKYKKNYLSNSNQIAFLSYDLIGLVYYLLYKNNFVVDNNIFYKKNTFKGKIGIFEIDKNIITHQLNFYVIENKNIRKIF